jgi:hypothetical protein
MPENGGFPTFFADAGEGGPSPKSLVGEGSAAFQQVAIIFYRTEIGGRSIRQASPYEKKR